jgi:hypothetical protein
VRGARGFARFVILFVLNVVFGDGSKAWEDRMQLRAGKGDEGVGYVLVEGWSML